MISALAWIPKGAAKPVPEQAEITEEELAALKAQAGEAEQRDEESDSEDDSDDEDLPDAAGPSDSEAEAEDEAAAVERAKAVAAALKSASGRGGGGQGGSSSAGGDALAAALAELDMDHYDDSDDELTMLRMLGSGNPGQAYYRDPSQDPLLKQAGGASSDEDSDSEADDFRLRESDLLILAARNEDDVSHLEVWVYEEPDERGPGNLYVHHSLLLPAFPLSVAWMDCDPTGRRERANLAAVGSFEPGIEIWDLDVIDAVEPIATLGGADYAAARAAAEAEAAEAAAGDDKKKKKKKKNKGKKGVPEVPVRPGSHEDAVLGLAWNREFRNVLASASADHTVKVWDVATQQCNSTLRHHSSKVQAVAWNTAEASVLLSGGFDRRACLVDMRVEGGSSTAAWEVSADAEAVAWNPHTPTQFVVSSEDGSVVCLDARAGAGSKPLFTLAAHDKAACALSFCPGAPGLLLTASTDKKVKLWGISADSRPSLLAAEDMKVGAVFAAGFCRDAPFVVAAGGAKGTVAVWDTTTHAGVAAYLQQQQQQGDKAS